MHPWHDIYVDDHSIETCFPVVIEVPMGSKNKYELDKETGLLRLDRVLYSAVHYPADYGFIPRTFCDDGEWEFRLGLDKPSLNFQRSGLHPEWRWRHYSLDKWRVRP
jgi:hypothetical protein